MAESKEGLKPGDVVKWSHYGSNFIGVIESIDERKPKVAKIRCYISCYPTSCDRYTVVNILLDSFVAKTEETLPEWVMRDIKRDG